MADIDPRLKDFRNFLYVVWSHLGLPKPTPVQYDIAEFIQNGPRRSVVMAFRGVGKSWITSAYVCHQLLLDPSKNILVVSASKNRADDFSTFTLRLIQEVPVLNHLMPTENQRASKVAFDVGPAPPQHAPSVTSKGITSQITGSRADIVIADDVEVPNNSATQTMREKLAESIKEFEAVLKPDGRILYLGTPQTESSIYNLLPDRGYTIRIWPIRAPKEKERVSYGDRLAPFVSALKPSELVEPDRFDEAELIERELSYGRSGFALQYMLDTSLSDADRYPLKINDLIVMDLNRDMAPQKMIWASGLDTVHPDIPCVGFNGDRYHKPLAIVGDWMPYTGSVMAIDPSGKGADETAYAVIKMLNGNLFVTEAGGLAGGYGMPVLQRIAAIAKDQKVNQILVEENFGQGMFAELLKPVLAKEHPCSIELTRHSIQKEKRIIDTLEPVMNQHRLVFDCKVIRNDYTSTKDLPPEKATHYQLMYQLSRVTRSKGSLAHDDRLDALAMAVAYWTEHMAQDADKKIAQNKAKALDRELERFMQGVIGRKPKGDTWMSV
jgi:hypothetical protein